MATRQRSARITDGKKEATSRQLAGQSTEARILSTAEKLFARSGYEAVTTKQLAAEVGLTIGAIYHHFPSKEALYEAVTQRAFARRKAPPKKLFNTDEPAEKRLARVVSWFISSIVSDKNFALLLQRELLDPRPHAPKLMDVEVFREALELFRSLVREILPDADVDEAFAAMLALSFGFASLKGIYLIVPGIRRTLSTPDEMADYATRLLLRGLAP